MSGSINYAGIGIISCYHGTLLRWGLRSGAYCN